MYICRLFHRDAPFEQIEARNLDDGAITIGRDPEADWTLAGGDATVSRIHCTLTVERGALTLHDRSTNGAFLGDGRRVAPGMPVAVGVGERICLGAMEILIDQSDDDIDTLSRTVVPPGPAADGWADDTALRPAHREAPLIEAFCAGAGLDASSLSGQDPALLMARVGAIYQETVAGLAALMLARQRLKADYQMHRTTIAAADNNLFKWTSARRLAQDLLAGPEGSFMTGAEAVRASFADLGRHTQALAAAGQAAGELAMATLSPAEIAAEADAQGFSLRGKAASCWDVHVRRHQALTEPAAGFDNALGRAFCEAYNAAESGD